MPVESPDIIQNDNEIKDFLQAAIVDKVNSHGDEANKEIKSSIASLHTNTKSIQNSLKISDGNIASLFQKIEEITDNINDLDESLDKISSKVNSSEKTLVNIKKTLPNDTIITNSVIESLLKYDSETLSPIRENISDCRNEIILIEKQLGILVQIDDTTKSAFELIQQRYCALNTKLDSLINICQKEHEKLFSQIEAVDSKLITLEEKTDQANSQILEVISAELDIKKELSNISSSLKRHLLITSCINTAIIVILLIVFHYT